MPIPGVTCSAHLGSPQRLGIGGATTVLHGGTIPAYSAVSLTADVSGTLPIANGGTGNTSAQTAIDALAGAVTDNRVLQGNGTHVVLGQIDDPAFFTTGAAAAAGAIGIVTTGTQTFDGAKTFSTSITSPAISVTSSPSIQVVNTFSSRSGNVILWTNNPTNSGSGITYNSGAGTFTVNSDGLYYVAATVEGASTIAAGITVGSTASPATLAYSASNLLAFCSDVAGIPHSMSGMTWLQSGTVIRVNTNAVNLSAAAQNGFTIVKVL